MYLKDEVEQDVIYALLVLELTEVAVEVRVRVHLVDLDVPVVQAVVLQVHLEGACRRVEGWCVRGGWWREGRGGRVSGD